MQVKKISSIIYILHFAKGSTEKGSYVRDEW